MRNGPLGVVVRRQVGTGRPVYLRSAGCWSTSVVAALAFDTVDEAERFMVENGTSMNHCTFEPAPGTFGVQGDGEMSAESQRAVEAIMTAAWEEMRS